MFTRKQKTIGFIFALILVLGILSYIGYQLNTEQEQEDESARREGLDRLRPPVNEPRADEETIMRRLDALKSDSPDAN